MCTCVKTKCFSLVLKFSWIIVWCIKLCWPLFFNPEIHQELKTSQKQNALLTSGLFWNVFLHVTLRLLVERRTVFYSCMMVYFEIVKYGLEVVAYSMYCMVSRWVLWLRKLWPCCWRSSLAFLPCNRISVNFSSTKFWHHSASSLL